MWLLISMVHAEGKTEGELPAFADTAPVISCCVERRIIEQAVQGQLDEIRACHTGTPARGYLRWTVEPDGAIAAVSVETGDSDRDVCLGEALAGLVFPALPCQLIVSYPLVFAQ